MLTFDLPPEIITYIFLKLPIKILLILKCVNKLFFDMISSPDFIKAHLKISSEDVNFSSHGAIVLSGSSQSLKQISFQSLLSNYLTDLVDLNCPTNESHSLNVFFVGSCNGLVCMIMDSKYFLVWNPCIGKYKHFPFSDVNTELRYHSAHGFVYDESNDDYKVVGIYYFNKEGSRDGLVKVYSFKRNSWKTIEGFKGDCLVCNWAKIASGKLHWFTYPLPTYPLPFGCKRDIVSFDVGNEVFGIVQQPNYGSGPFISTLGLLGGCLCVLCDDINTRNTDLWVMKEYGVKDSWAKTVTISCIDDAPYVYKIPLSMLPNGEILFGTTDSFVIYNPKDNSFTMTRKWDFKTEPVIYAETLVSPIGYEG